jgi:hypothetical protein
VKTGTYAVAAFALLSGVMYIHVFLRALLSGRRIA